MKTRREQLVARLAIAVVCLGGAAWCVRADEPRVFPGAPQFAPGGMASQPSPYAAAESRGGPYVEPSASSAASVSSAAMAPGAYTPAMGPYGCTPAMGPNAYNPAMYGCAAPAEPCGGDGGGCLGGHFARWCDAMHGAEWRYAATGVFLQRQSAGSQTLLRNGFDTSLPPSSSEVFNAKDLPFDIPGGCNVSIARLSTYGWDLEANYTHVDSFQAIRTIAGNVFLQTDRNGGTFTVLNPQLQDNSLLNSCEANFRWHLNERLRLLTGFRWIELQDRYAVDSIGAEFLVPVTLRNNTLNELYGFQLGSDAALFDWGFVTLDFGAKLGVYNNSASQNSHEVDTGFVDRSVAAQGQHTAFSAELNVGGTVEVIMDRLFLRAGYQLLWLDGVLLAPDQIGVNNFRNFTAGLRPDTVLYHGAYAAVELSF